MGRVNPLVSGGHHNLVKIKVGRIKSEICTHKTTHMTKQKTLYQIILDCSGSMSNCEKETIEGYNEQVQFLKGLQEKFPDQEIEVSLTTFNDKVTSVMELAAPSQLKTLDSSHYRPYGSTAMFDAIGTSVQRLENKFHACNVQTPTTVVV